jgi:predicted Zn-dependent peptidase
MIDPRQVLARLAASLVLPLGLLLPHAFAAEPTRARVPVETFELDNGMRWLLVRRPELTTVSAGWVAHVGSANERPGITGLTHLFEHMMFKGTRAIGTTDITRDIAIIEEQEKLQAQIRDHYARQASRWRQGEIDDPFDPKHRTPDLIELERQFQALVEEQRSLMIKDEFDKVYTEAGGSGMNAFTNQDMTVYFITVPSNKTELWFWLESDRIRNLVLREFYSERDVVHEERRLRTESTPTGKFDELYEAMFWQAHPYGWPVVGWPSDLRVISKAQADEYYATHYTARNLTAAVVGNFDPEQVKAFARKYFGPMPPAASGPPPVVTLELPQLAEQRMIAECDCQPQIAVGYKTVPFRHKDSYALQVLSGLLNGQTGRLYKSLVLDKKIATSASSSQQALKWAGAFYFSAETKAEGTPEQLEAAWYEELRKLVDDPIPPEELQKVKNQIAASAYRRIENGFSLMVQLLRYDGLGDWTYINDWTDKALEVTEQDLKRVAKQFLTKENRTVGVYHRKPGAEAEPEPPELASVPEEMRPMVKNRIKQMRDRVAAVDDPAALEGMLAQMEQQKANAPEPMRKAFPIFERIIRERLETLRASAPKSPSEGGK